MSPEMRRTNVIPSSERLPEIEQQKTNTLPSTQANHTELQLHARWEGNPIAVDLFTYEPSRENVWMYGVDD